MNNALPRLIAPALWAGAMVVSACGAIPSGTDLRPEGPPRILQVRLAELYGMANATRLERVVFGFGTHPEAGADEEHPVTSAVAVGNQLRIVLDELVGGSALEEIACRAVVDDDAFSRVPEGATPDDVARCAAARDALPVACPASSPRSVCLCARDGGCPDSDGGYVTPRGEPVGVVDADQDGAADRTRFVAGAVAIRCGAIDVPIDLDRSYWTASGNQRKAAQGGFDGLGPAVVLVPGPAPGVALPTGLACGVVFSPEVVDRDGKRVCAPPSGDLAASCTPGDTRAFQFTVEPLAFAVASILLDPGQSRAADIRIAANAPLNAASLAGVTVLEGAASYAQFTAAPSTPDEIVIHWTAPGGLAPNTRYTVTVPTTVTDAYGQAAARPFELSFTTGAN